MERSPVSLERLTLLDTAIVIYQGKFHPSLGTDHRCLTPLEFLALLVPHVHHRYECRLRFYGAASTTHRRRWGRIGAHPGPPPTRPHEREEADEFSASIQATLARRKRNWAHLIRKVWHADPEICPNCRAPMKWTAPLVSPRNDDAIRAILKARGEWAPPWLRAPPSQAPPSDFAPAEREIIYDIAPDAIDEVHLDDIRDDSEIEA